MIVSYDEDTSESESAVRVEPAQQDSVTWISNFGIGFLSKHLSLYTVTLHTKTGAEGSHYARIPQHEPGAALLPPLSHGVDAPA